MDGRLLSYFERELRYLREVGHEFAKEFPKVAGRLSLEEFACRPVCRAAPGGICIPRRARPLKLDAEFPRIFQSLLQTIYPHYLSPTPSMCVVQFEPEFERTVAGRWFPFLRADVDPQPAGAAGADGVRISHRPSRHAVSRSSSRRRSTTPASCRRSISRRPSALDPAAPRRIRLRLRCTSGEAILRAQVDDAGRCSSAAPPRSSRGFTSRSLAHGPGDRGPGDHAADSLAESSRLRQVTAFAALDLKTPRRCCPTAAVVSRLSAAARVFRVPAAVHVL